MPARPCRCSRSLLLVGALQPGNTMQSGARGLAQVQRLVKNTLVKCLDCTCKAIFFFLMSASRVSSRRCVFKMLDCSRHCSYAFSKAKSALGSRNAGTLFQMLRVVVSNSEIRCPPSTQLTSIIKICGTAPQIKRLFFFFFFCFFSN